MVNRNILLYIYLIILSIANLIVSIYTYFKLGVILSLLLLIGLIIALTYNIIKLHKKSIINYNK